MTISGKFKALMQRVALPFRPQAERIVYLQMTKAGTRVTHDMALTVSAFWAGIRAIADPIGYLSWHVFERGTSGKKRREDLFTDWILNNEPNPEMSAGTFREVMMAHALSWGNGYAEIERDGSGRPMALWPLPPDRVEPMRHPETGQLYYVVYPQAGAAAVIPARDMFHLKGLGFDGIVGYSVVRLAAESLGLAKALEDNAATYFGNGSRPDGVLTYEGKVSDEIRETTRREWEKAHRGPAKAYRMAVLDQGLKYNAISLSNTDSQFIESRKLSITEFSRWLKVPPHKLSDLERATFSNIEHLSIEFVTDALMPWINKLEQEANIKLFGYGSQGRLFTKLNVRTLLRGDLAAQSSFLTAMIDRGVYDINEAREFLDMDPIGEDGKKRFVPLNMQLLENAGEEPEPQPAEVIDVEPVEDDEDPDADEEDADDEPIPNNRLNGATK